MDRELSGAEGCPALTRRDGAIGQEASETAGTSPPPKAGQIDWKWQ